MMTLILTFTNITYLSRIEGWSGQKEWMLVDLVGYDSERVVVVKVERSG